MFDPDALIAAVETVCGVPRMELSGGRKTAQLVRAKEVLIVSGRRLGATTGTLAHLTRLNSSTVSRRYDAAITRSHRETETENLVSLVIEHYNKARTATLQAQPRLL